MKTDAALREKIWSFLESPKGFWGKALQVLLIALVALSSVQALAEFLTPDFFSEYRRLIFVFDWAISILFGVEYFVRLWATPDRRRFVFSFEAIVDFLAFFPTLILLLLASTHHTLVLRLLRLFRLFRALKLLRYSKVRIRTKIFLAFTASTLIILVPTLFFVYNYFAELKEKDIKAMLLGSVVSASGQLTADELLVIRSEDDPAYARVQQRLQTIRDSLRASGIPVRYVYTMKKSATNQLQNEYLVDAEVGEKHSRLGAIRDTVKDQTPWSTNFATAQTSPRFEYDDDGKTLLLTSSAPLRYSGAGHPVILGMDLTADDVNQSKRFIGFIVIAILGGAILLISFISMLLAAYFNKPITEILKGIQAFETQDFDYKVKILTGDELGEVGELFNTRLFQLMRDFYQFMYAPVAKLLMGPERQSIIEGKYEHASVLFTDFKGFTSTSSLFAPRQVVEFLNQAFDILESTVASHNGIIDKHIGDALMVYFIPQPGETNTARRAVVCALAMQEAYLDFHLQKLERGELSCPLRIGVNSGDVILGALGSKKLEVTVIGNTVNMANRMESAATPGGIGLSPSTSVQSQVAHWIKAHPGWQMASSKVDVKHLDGLDVVQLFKEGAGGDRVSVKTKGSSRK